MPPAARVTDPTTHGAPLSPGPGSVNVVIAALAAWRTTIDQHACPATSISGPDGVGSVLLGSPTVWINAQMACRQGDIVVEKPGLAMGPADPILMGCLTVDIGGPVASISITGGVMTATWGGLTITGSPSDVTTFVSMLSAMALNSRTGAGVLATITGDTGHPVTCRVGRNQPGVFGDAFNTNAVDLADLQGFPASARAGHNDFTTDEALVHFLTERHDSAANGSNFNTAHQAGINAQNQLRGETGQSQVVSQQLAGHDAAGNSIARFTYADGTHEDYVIGPGGNIVSRTPAP